MLQPPAVLALPALYVSAFFCTAGDNSSLQSCPALHEPGVQIRRAREARMARFGSAEGRERAQKIADEAVAAGITDQPAGSDARSARRSDGGVRKRVGGFGQVDSGGSGGGGGGGGGDGGPGAGGSGDKYKKGQECA